ncbi:DUF1285 domain-containing protein [Methyloligella sp. 2.7D]|uniref:DUF1285 domain-containing protein n=1 Tax=unclassified Methyloligella TaxID=2625955 RepID=UPI00157D3D8B|nr:DUF1285 domain-containing protein [Methyloligella sp. GL2]
MATETEAQAAASLTALQGKQDGGKQAETADQKGRREPTFCGDIGMEIRRDGTWFYQGSPIGRKALVKLFATVLRKEADGTHYLVTPVEKVSVKVEDSPFLAVAMAVIGEGKDQALSFRTNLDDEVTTDAAHPLSFRPESDGSFTPYVLVRDALLARVNRAVFYDLVELAVEHEGRLGVWSGGTFFAFPQID